MYKAILFDFGGVIYQHPKEVIPEIFLKIFNASQEEALKEYDKYKDDYFKGKIATDKLIKIFSDDFKLNKSVEEVKNLWVKYYGEMTNPNLKVLEIIKSLKKNYKVYLFSNTSDINNIYNSKTGIFDNFDGLFLSFQMGMKKPDKKIYEKVISEIKLLPQECVFIDDKAENLVPAKELGMTTILFDVLKNPVEKLEEELRKYNLIF